MMGSNAVIQTRPSNSWDNLVRLGDADGSASHPHMRRLVSGTPAQRILSDAVHALCAVHGQHPGMIADIVANDVHPAATEWLLAAAAGFADERAYLAYLTAAVGPVPSTPGQAQSETALLGERHALTMLARSERTGCATGAAAALLYDWTAIRSVLDVAAERFGFDAPASTFPSDSYTEATIAELGAFPAHERAMLFGAQQLFAQHRGLWALLEARASARGDL